MYNGKDESATSYRNNNKGDELGRYLLLAINGKVETTIL